MRIALISYEYPPDTATGGIGTYFYQAAHLLKNRGHEIEVFAGTTTHSRFDLEEGIPVHRVWCKRRNHFESNVAPVYAARHRHRAFDVLESGEYFLDGYTAHSHTPEVPLVVKLHSPTLLLAEINADASSLTGGFFSDIKSQALAILGAKRHGCRVPRFHLVDVSRRHLLDLDRLEEVLSRKANLLLSPSADLLRLQKERWNLAPERCRVLPNPFVAAKELLELPLDGGSKQITFLGRLEIRKGILDLAEALPPVLETHPDWRFQFAGRGVYSERLGSDTTTYLQERLGRFGDRVSFLGSYSASHLPEIFANCEIGIFPSVWENFPNVCLEAMAAGRTVVGSRAGGMAEMIADGENGRLVSPKNPAEIVSVLDDLIQHPAQRLAMGAAARASILERYSDDIIGPAMEEAYKTAIENKRLGLTVGAS